MAITSASLIANLESRLPGIKNMVVFSFHDTRLARRSISPLSEKEKMEARADIAAVANGIIFSNIWGQLEEAKGTFFADDHKALIGEATGEILKRMMPQLLAAFPVFKR